MQLQQKYLSFRGVDNLENNEFWMRDLPPKLQTVPLMQLAIPAAGYNRTYKECSKCHHPVRKNTTICKTCGASQKAQSKKTVFEEFVEQGKKALLQCNVHHIFNKIQEQMAQLHGAGYRCLLLWHRPSEDGRKKQTSGWRAFSPTILELMTVEENGRMELSAYGKMVLETFIAMHMEIIAKENGDSLQDEEAELIEEDEVDLSWYNLDQSQPSPPNSDSDTAPPNNDVILLPSKDSCIEQQKTLTPKVSAQVTVSKNLSSQIEETKIISPNVSKTSQSSIFSLTNETSTTPSNSSPKQIKHNLSDIPSCRITPSPSSSSSSHVSYSYSLPKSSQIDLNSSSFEYPHKFTDSSHKLNFVNAPKKPPDLSPAISKTFHKNSRETSIARPAPRHRSLSLSALPTDEPSVDTVYKMMSPKVILFKLSKDKVPQFMSSVDIASKTRPCRTRKNNLFVKGRTAVHSMNVSKKRRISVEEQPILKSGNMEYQLTIAQTTDDWDRIDCPCGKPYRGRPMTICLICKRWWHDQCAGLKWRKKQNPYWTCNHCNKNTALSIMKEAT